MNGPAHASVRQPNMKTALLLAVLFCAQLAHGAEGWSNDYVATMKLAKQTKKPLLLEFTGTKWCPVCIAFGKNVLSTDEFKNYVKDRFAFLAKWLPAVKKMKAAGIKIINSIPGLKVHAKVALIKRVENKQLQHYSLLSTGNLNESTGRFYTDNVFFTGLSKYFTHLFTLHVVHG